MVTIGFDPVTYSVLEEDASSVNEFWPLYSVDDICVEVVTIDMIHYVQYISDLKFFALHKQVCTQPYSLVL